MLYDKPIVYICLRFLLKSNKAQEEDDSREATKTAAMPTTPVAKETTPCPPSQPDPALLQPETSTTEMPEIQNSSPHSPMETHLASPLASATSTLPVQQEDVPISQNAVQPKLPAIEKERPEDDGEKAGPSGLNAHPFSSSSTAPSAPFIPFSGGGQRLGGPGGGAMGRSLSNSSSSSSLSALTTAVESPKAKKAKSSHGSSTKVSHITTRSAHRGKS